MADPAPWEMNWETGPSKAGPLPSPPQSPSKQREEQRQDKQLKISERNLNLGEMNYDRQTEYQNFEKAQGLAQDYNQQQAVKDYQNTLPILATALSTSADGAGDNALIYAYAKLMDPSSAVREGEAGAAASGQNAIEATIAKLKGKLDDGGQFSPAYRNALRQEMIKKVASLKSAYNFQRDRYTETAKRLGVDPYLVVGDSLADSPEFHAKMQAYDKANGLGQFAGQPDENSPLSPAPPSGPGTAIAPQMRGGLPIGTQVTFEGNGGDKDQWWDRAKWLKDTYGITPDQETQITAFWTQNSGNQNLTPEAVKTYFAANNLPAPSDADIAKWVDYAKQGKTFTNFDDSAAKEAYRQQLQGDLNAQGFDPTSAAAYGDSTARELLMGGADEIDGIAAGGKALFNGENPVAAYRFGRDTSRLADQQMWDKQGTGGYVARGLGIVGSGFLVPGGQAGDVVSLAKGGAKAGAISGFLSGNGMNDSLTKAGIGGGVGAMLGAGTGKIGDYLLARRAARAADAGTDGAEVIGAADRLNDAFGTKIEPLPADVSGPGVQNLTAGAAKMPLSAAPIVKGADKLSAEAQKARDAIASLAGDAAGLEGGGEAALAGAQAYMKRSKAHVDRLYDQARALGGDTPIDMAEARKVLDQNIAELEATPGGAKGLAELKALRAELDQPYTVEGIKRMRTQIRDKFIGDGLRGSDLERRFGMVIDAADQDITSGLERVGKAQAADAYRTAARAYADRADMIDNVVAPVIGKKGDAPLSGEQIIANINRMSSTNNARLGRFIGALPADDAATVRATLISRLGLASKGTQNAAGDAFSLPQFLTQWNGISAEAKRTLFGPQLRSALDDLAKVAEGTKTAQRFANTSGTGTPIGLVGTGAVGTMFFSHPIVATALLGGQYSLGRLLSSPGFARWLAKAPNVQSRAMPAYVAKLTSIAGSDAAISNDVLAFQRRLASAFTESPARRAAADDENNDVGGKPPR